uniref:Iron hydrogenase large subunit C-terminal domain-containing protein n=1 Tax=Arcella intermedia TaxID=1963864 RepID=A0A6B2L3G2_9EUKA
MRITGLDDFMALEKECVVIKNDLKPQPVQKREYKIEVNEDGSLSELRGGERTKLEATKISLADCLACSGCVTTSETILIESQGVSEFLRNVRPDKMAVISISPQSRASLATHFQLDQNQLMGKLTTFFQELGVQYVFDCGLTEEIYLMELAKEFLHKQRSKTDTTMLTGTCPGWICYAEKTHPDLLPSISTTKSAQQLMGNYIKNHFAKKIGVPIYHATVMPCFDRKLESTRQEHKDPISGVSEVDCVLSTFELLQLIQDKKTKFEEVPESPLTHSFMDLDQKGRLCGFLGGTSGGYLEYVYRTAAKELWGINVQEVVLKPGKNTDFMEVDLEVEGKVVLKFARANGFRNIQNIVRRLKRNKKEFDFVEIMACPGGCTNGGGQIRSADSDNQEAKKLLSQVNATYQQTNHTLPGLNPTVQEIYSKLQNDPEKLHTQYKAVPKLESRNPLSIKW